MMQRLIKRITAIATSAFMLLSVMPAKTYAVTGNTKVTGKVYEFGEKSEYKYAEAETFTSTSTADTYGTLELDGNVIDSTEKDGIPVYEVEEGVLDIVYDYDDTLLNADIDSWHLYEDDTDKIDGKELGADVQKGAILVYTSMDRINWTKAVSITNAFSKTPTSSDSIYTTKDVELINGCYYKVVVAYGTRIRTDNSNILFIDTDKFDYKKYAEVYECLMLSYLQRKTNH